MLQNGVNTKNQDDCWMNMAIKLASNGIGLTSPNPCVGAVIVHENQVIGSGFHKKAGLPHAEREAIADGVANGNAPPVRGLNFVCYSGTMQYFRENTALYGCHFETSF